MNEGRIIADIIDSEYQNLNTPDRIANFFKFITNSYKTLSYNYYGFHMYKFYTKKDMDFKAGLCHYFMLRVASNARHEIIVHPFNKGIIFIFIDDTFTQSDLIEKLTNAIKISKTQNELKEMIFNN